jgi:hypothetical protein
MAQIDAKMWQHLVDTGGVDQARQWAVKSGYNPPAGYEVPNPTSPEAPGAEKPLGAEAPVAKAPPAAAATSGLPGLTVEGLYNRVLAQQEQEAKQRTARFNRATEELSKQRSGPALSERLYQLSAALASPVPARGSRFAGVMANVMPVLAQQHAATREAKTLDKRALQALQDKYDEANSAGTTQATTTQLALLKLREEQEKAILEAREKAKGKISSNQVTGQLQTIPDIGSMAHPQNDADWAKLPGDTWYFGYRGRYAGQPLYKPPDGNTAPSQ